MKKKVLSAVLSVAMVASLLVGCGGAADSGATTDAPAEEAPAEDTAADDAAADDAAADDAAADDAAADDAAADDAAADDAAAPAGGGKVGVSMPTKDLQRWNQDGANMESELKEAGYEVDLQYASNDVQTQLSQIENMISGKCDVLVIAAIEGSSLGEALDMAKDAGIPVIAYDRLLMDSDAVSYYATFDNYKVGTVQGEYVKEQLDLDNAEGPFNIEFTAGDPGDNNAGFFFNGAYDVLKEYIDSGKLKVVSGQTKFDDVATPTWATDVAQSRAENILSSFYSDGTNVDVWLCSNDSTALGVENALAANYNGTYPIITGQDCDIENTKNMIAGKQSMSVFKDTRTLASQVVKMVGQNLTGAEVDVNDTETYNNNVITVPSYLCEPVFADANNYKELLIDSGYYTEDQLK
ncbi:MAG: sugar-binding protein [Lachnospiraceae bacterium]|nr:sugar-binding protein [Lachnospiraceae bacterium]